MSQLDARYSLFEDVLGTSQKLIKHLEQADKWDRIYMLASMGFLALVVSWIVWRRVLKAPVLFFLTIFRFLPFTGSHSKTTEAISATIIETVTAVVSETTVSVSPTEIGFSAGETVSETASVVTEVFQSVMDEL